jgi:hypothetical protein
MSESFGSYILGVVYFSVGLAALLVALIQDQMGILLCLGPAGFVYLLWGAALMEGISRRDFTDYVRALFQRRSRV